MPFHPVEKGDAGQAEVGGLGASECPVDGGGGSSGVPGEGGGAHGAGDGQPRKMKASRWGPPARDAQAATPNRDAAGQTAVDKTGKAEVDHGTTFGAGKHATIAQVFRDGCCGRVVSFLVRLYCGIWEVVSQH